jgi:hypothetical protein
MTSRDDTQYSLLKILTIWAIVATPMPILAFVVAPMIAPQGHWHYLLSAWLMLICGMIWQFIVSVWILYHELDDFTWAAIKARIWLQAPRDPNTGAYHVCGYKQVELPRLRLFPKDLRGFWAG